MVSPNYEFADLGFSKSRFCEFMVLPFQFSSGKAKGAIEITIAVINKNVFFM